MFGFDRLCAWGMYHWVDLEEDYLLIEYDLWEYYDTQVRNLQGGVQCQNKHWKGVDLKKVAHRKHQETDYFQYPLHTVIHCYLRDCIRPDGTLGMGILHDLVIKTWGFL